MVASGTFESMTVLYKKRKTEPVKHGRNEMVTGGAANDDSNGANSKESTVALPSTIR